MSLNIEGKLDDSFVYVDDDCRKVTTYHPYSLQLPPEGDYRVTNLADGSGVKIMQRIGEDTWFVLASYYNENWKTEQNADIKLALKILEIFDPGHEYEMSKFGVFSRI